MSMRFICSFFSLSFCFSASALDAPALLTMIKGEVQIFSEPQTTAKKSDNQVLYENKYWSSRKAKMGEKIFSGSVIHTGVDGKARLVYPNSDQLNIGPGSSVIVDRKTLAGNEIPQTDVQIMYGKLRAVVQKNEGDTKERFRVKTPTAVAGVRGTDFAAGFNPNNALSDVSVLRGEVQVSSAKDAKKSIALKPGNTVTVQEPVKAVETDKAAKKDAAVEKSASTASAPKAVASVFEVKTTSQEQLVEIQKATHIKLDEKELKEAPKAVQAEIQKTETLALKNTLQSIKIEDPQLYKRLESVPAKDVSELNVAAVGKALETAPRVTPPEIKRKKLQEELNDLDEDIYKKYFKVQ